MLFDSYTLRARLAPAVLAALPAVGVLAAGALSPGRATGTVGIAIGSIGLVVAGLVRDRGRQIQPALWKSWGGSPTLRRLRWRDGGMSPQAVGRLHARVNALLDEELPDAPTEAADPAEADRRYEEAITILRERTRDHARFPLVLAENKEYGFRRNMLGLRPLGIAVAVVSAAVSVAALVAPFAGSDDIAWIVSAASSTVVGLLWGRLVTPDWVRGASELYADRLFEAAESLRLDRS